MALTPFALANLQEDPEEALWQLARNVDGWGRVHTVARLAGTQNPAIKDWLLRDGYKNSIMYEYTAYICARTGDLVNVLATDEIDDELLDGAGEIIQTLIDGREGPAEGIDDYADGPTAVGRYLDHVLSSAPKLNHLVHVNAIRRFLQDGDADWSAEARIRWREDRGRLESTCTTFIERPE